MNKVVPTRTRKKPYKTREGCILGALRILANEGPQGGIDLAEKLQLSARTVSRLMTNIQREGWPLKQELVPHHYPKFKWALDVEEFVARFHHNNHRT